VLLEAYRATDEWKAELELTEHRLSTAQNDPAKVAVLMETARLVEGRGTDIEGAFGYVRRAFLITPWDVRVEGELERLAEATKQWRSLAEAQREALGLEGHAADSGPISTPPPSPRDGRQKAPPVPESSKPTQRASVLPPPENWSRRLRFRMGELLEG